MQHVFEFPKIEFSEPSSWGLSQNQPFDISYLLIIRHIHHPRPPINCWCSQYFYNCQQLVLSVLKLEQNMIVDETYISGVGTTTKERGTQKELSKNTSQRPNIFSPLSFPSSCTLTYIPMGLE